MGGCAAGSSTAPPCASLPALDTFRPSRREHQDWSLLPSSPKASERPTRSVRALRDLEQRAQIKRISLAENSSREIQESGINPDKTSLNLISGFGSRSEQISASRKPLFLDTTLCLKEPAQETMITQGQESCLHTPVWGVEGFNISTSKEVEGELTTGKQLTRVFNGLLEENTTEDTAMTTTINFDDLLLEESVFVSTSIAPMDMIEEEENLIEEATTSFLIKGMKVEVMKEEMGEATKANKRSRVKMEELTEEEKYRRMREQNNRASQACRAKRKRKLAEEEQELTTLQEKNIHLQAVLKSMQEEVALYKKRILEQVSGVRN